MITLRSTHYNQNEKLLLKKLVEEMQIGLIDWVCDDDLPCEYCKYRTLCNDIKYFEHHVSEL